MVDVLKVASYICQRYEKAFGRRIDEMKLHKLLYFTQREAIAQTGSPMFDARFKAWKYGPVLLAIRKYYKNGTHGPELSGNDKEKYKNVFDSVFETYAGKDSWSLSTLTHCEYSWMKAREGYGPDDPCDVDINPDDIKVDADRIRERKAVIKLWKDLKKSSGR